jgi:hypothetical protein
MDLENRMAMAAAMNAVSFMVTTIGKDDWG